MNVDIKVFNGGGLLHHFLYEIGRVSKTLGWHYSVSFENGKVRIKTSKAEAIVEVVNQHDLKVEIIGEEEYENQKITIIEPDVFTEVPYRKSFVINGEEYDYIEIPGWGILTSISSFIFEAIGKYVLKFNL